MIYVQRNEPVHRYAVLCKEACDFILNINKFTRIRWLDPYLCVVSRLVIVCMFVYHHDRHACRHSYPQAHTVIFVKVTFGFTQEQI